VAKKTGLEQVAETFREEASERLAELEAALLALESDPNNADLVGSAFRALHTIKGSGAMFGFDDIAQFAHEVETAFDLVRNGKLAISKPLIGLTLRSMDLIKAMLGGKNGRDGWDRAEREALVTGLRALVAGGRTYRVRFRPETGLFKDGSNPLPLLAELRELGRCEIVAETAAIPPLDQLDVETCNVGWDVQLTTDRDINAIRDVFIFVEGRCELTIEEVAGGRVDDQPNAATPAAAAATRVAATPADAPPAAPAAAKPEAQPQAAKGKGKRDNAATADAGSSIRVSAQKLDQLVDLVGELVIAQARLAEIAGRHEDAELASVAEDMARLSADLRDNTLSVRMIPIGTTFNRFTRLVRDLSSELGKEMELVTEGADTELDKTVIERLGDPMVHLIRNSCDHGIESPAVRIAAGKPARGTVRLRAYHAGRHVVVEIQDDGKGLDTAAIRAKAIERGLIAPDAQLNEAELFDLIFLPGFSTAAQISNVSGRGVGMDVVKRSITALRGSIAIESKRGAGSTIRITLPLTLAIIEGLLVAVGDTNYVLPMTLVEECVELSRQDVAQANGNRLIPVRGELVPYMRLREWFAVEGEPPAIEQIAIVTAGELRFGFAVDHVVGQHQTVIKALGNLYQNVEGISGATILGDGTVALIVDAPALMRTASAGVAGAH
jgi:two-component system chemotaxis sensor kinase CheA